VSERKSTFFMPIMSCFLSVSPTANLTTLSVNRTYHQGETATLECSSLGGPDNTYQWQANRMEAISTLQGVILNQSILMLPNVTASTGGMYTCTVSNIAGNHSESTVVFVSPHFLNQPLDQQTSVSSTVHIVCDVEAFPDPEYLWQRVDGQAIRNGLANDERNLSISVVQFGDEGEYYCNASARGTTIRSRNILLTGKHSGIMAVGAD
jgi:hypothetical protein